MDIDVDTESDEGGFDYYRYKRANVNNNENGDNDDIVIDNNYDIDDADKIYGLLKNNNEPISKRFEKQDETDNNGFLTSISGEGNSITDEGIGKRAMENYSQGSQITEFSYKILKQG